MLISLKMNNMFIFGSETEFSLTADMRSRRFKSNLISVGDENVVKSAVIMGPNNVGKSNLIKCIGVIKRILSDNHPYRIESNMFSENTVCSFEVVFGYDNKVYKLTAEYDTKSNRFISEKYSSLTKKDGKQKETEIMSRKWTSVKGKAYLDEKVFGKNTDTLYNVVLLSSYKCLMIHLIDEQQSPEFAAIKKIYTSFAESIDIVDMNHIGIKNTIEMMKLSDESQKKISTFIKCADLYLDEIKLLNDDQVKIELDLSDNSIIHNRLPSEYTAAIIEQLHMCSVYKGHSLPSVLFDSEGTRKMTALASYVINALNKGRTLIVDELDSSLHFKLLRAVISLFNNQLNTSAQLIATVHDISLLDCKRLFRKEQIWFAHKDSEGVYLYSLAEFTSDNDGVRETSNLIEKYKNGVFGALPYPDLYDVLTKEEVTDDESSDDVIDFLSLIYDEGDEDHE